MYSSISITVLGRVLMILYSVASIRIATEILGSNQMGAMNIILSIVTFFVIPISSISLFFSRHAVEWHIEGNLIKNTIRYCIFLVIVAIAASVTLLLIYYSISSIQLPAKFEWIIAIVVGNILFANLNGILLQAINSIGNRTAYVILSNFSVWIGLAFATSIVSNFGANAGYWLLGLLSGQALALVFSIIFIIGGGEKGLQPAVSKQAASFNISAVYMFSWPLLLSTLFYWFQKDGYRLVMAAYTNNEVIGLFTVTFGLGVMVMVSFETLYREYYSPIFYKAISHSTYEQKIRAWNQYISVYFPSIAFTTIFIIGSGHFLVRILLSAEFHTSSWIMVYGVLTHAMAMIYAAYLNLTFALLNNKAIIQPNILGATLVFGLMILLVPWDPYYGSGIALVVGIIVTMLDTSRRLGKQHKLIMPWKRIGIGCIAGVPVVLVFEWGQYQWQNPTQIVSLLFLMITGLYFLFVQLMFIKRWIHKDMNRV